MKHLLLLILLAAPAMAHQGPHYNPQVDAPEMGAAEYVDDYVNHGFITCYGRSECIAQWNAVGTQGRMIVPGESRGISDIHMTNL